MEGKHIFGHQAKIDICKTRNDVEPGDDALGKEDESFHCQRQDIDISDRIMKSETTLKYDQSQGHERCHGKRFQEGRYHRDRGPSQYHRDRGPSQYITTTVSHTIKQEVQ